MKQMTLSMTGYFDKGKKTRREQFLAAMDRVVPWGRLCALIEPHYPKASKSGGRPPIVLERMLRIYCLQQWYNLSDPAAEEALYDLPAPVVGLRQTETMVGLYRVASPTVCFAGSKPRL